MMTLKEFKESGYFLKNKGDFGITFEEQYNHYSVICFKDNSKSKAFKLLSEAIDYFLKLINDRDVAELQEFRNWCNSQPTPPTADQMNNYWKEKNKDKPKQKETTWLNYDPWGNDCQDNYKGLGNGNYTMEEYVDYELDPQDVRGDI